MFHEILWNTYQISLFLWIIFYPQVARA